MDGLRKERTGVVAARLWDPGSGGRFVGRVALTIDVSSIPRSEVAVRDEAELRRIVGQWLENLIAAMREGGES